MAEYLRRAGVVGITWPVPTGLDDAALEARLFSPPFTPREALRPQPDWVRVHAELRRPGVTLLLLWQEYRAEHPEGYGYSRFCDLYAEWRDGSTASSLRNGLDRAFAPEPVPETPPIRYPNIRGGGYYH